MAAEASVNVKKPVGVKRRFRFVATELRDRSVTQHFTAIEGSVIELDESSPEQGRFILQITGKDKKNDKSASWVETKNNPTIFWEETPENADPAKIVENFIKMYKRNKQVRAQAMEKGVRVLDVGERV